MICFGRENLPMGYVLQLGQAPESGVGNFKTPVNTVIAIVLPLIVDVTESVA